MPDTATLDEARALVAAVVIDDVADVDERDDLRDLGLDSIRLMTLLSDLRAAGTVLDVDELAADPTLRGLADALDRARVAP